MPIENSPGTSLAGELLKDPALLEGILSAAKSLLGRQNSQDPSKEREQDGEQPAEARSRMHQDLDGERIPALGERSTEVGETAMRERSTEVGKFAFGGNPEQRKRLLLALKPYLNAERQGKVDTILAMMGMLDAAATAGLFGKSRREEL